MGEVLKSGARVRSITCDTEAVVVRAPAGEVDLRCGGQPMVPVGEGEVVGPPAAGFDTGTQIGKRYPAADIGLELLCTKAGAGSISVGDEVLHPAGAKPLPASD
ncbi:MAG TPA: hypothetical protein VFI47_06720 [Acidimicrobiales bacterium]|nr:hypothetical protein [Acidimicrobiales bacterium]